MRNWFSLERPADVVADPMRLPPGVKIQMPFNAAFVFVHYPPTVNASATNGALHFGLPDRDGVDFAIRERERHLRQRVQRHDGHVVNR